MDESDEVWKPIVGFADYEASSAGRIRNGRGRILAGNDYQAGSAPGQRAGFRAGA